MRGQASTEYAGALLLVALVLGAAAALAPLPALGASVLGAVRHGLCLVGAGVCSPDQARAEGLDPCPVQDRANREEAAVSLGIVKLGRGDALAIERRSDGSASVSFLDGWKGGAEAGIGVRFTPLGLDGRATAGAGLTFTGGRRWDFASWDAADDFVGRHARHETITGEARGAICFFCDDGRPPPADAVFHEGGAYVDAALDAGLPRGIDVGAELELATVIGRRTAGRTSTTYVKVSGESTGRLGAALASLASDNAGEVVLELTSYDGRPRELRATAAAAVGLQAEALGAGADLGRIAERLRDARAGAGAGTGAGLAAEATVALDLRDPANLEAAQGVLAALRSPWRLGSSMAALGSRMDSDGTLDVRVFRSGVERTETGGDAALGLKFGANYERVERGRSLLAAWTSEGGGPLREREDCTYATARAREA